VLDHPGLANFLFSVLTVWPLAQVLRRAGLNAAFSLLVFVPVIGFVLVLLALSMHSWPNLPPRPTVPAAKRRREV